MKNRPWTVDLGLWTFWLLVLGPWSMVPSPVFSKEPTLVYHLHEIEKQDGVVRELSSRVQGDAITSPFEESYSLKLKDLPPLSVTRKISEEKKDAYRTDFSLEMKDQSIPLNDDETKQNTILRPYGISEIHFEGQGRFWTDAGKKVLAEEFVLSGRVIQNGKTTHWQIEKAYALGERPRTMDQGLGTGDQKTGK